MGRDEAGTRDNDDDQTTIPTHEAVQSGGQIRTHHLHLESPSSAIAIGSLSSSPVARLSVADFPSLQAHHYITSAWLLSAVIRERTPPS